MALQSRCPHCRKILKLKSKSAFGKQVPCPKCGERFTVKPFEAQEPEPDEWEEDYEEACYEDGHDGAPMRSSKSGSQKKRKKRRKATRQSSVHMNKILIAGLACFGLSILTYASMSAGAIDDLGQDNESFKESFIAPTRKSVSLTEPGQYWFYNISHTTHDGTEYDVAPHLPDDVTVTVTGPDHREIALDTSGKFTGKSNDLSYELIGTLQIPTAGDYVFDVAGEMKRRPVELTNVNVLSQTMQAAGGLLAGLLGILLSGCFAFVGLILTIVGLIVGRKNATTEAE